MFERRLKVFLSILIFIVALLLVRAFQLQVVTRGQWVAAAEELKKKAVLVETTRGSLLDCKGLQLAVDESCMDACVDYRAICRDEKWIRGVARDRLISRRPDEWKSADKKTHEAMVDDEAPNVKADIDREFELLAKVTGQSAEQIEETCHDIDLKIAMRSRRLQWRRYQKADEDHQNAPTPPWYRRWLVEGGKEGPQLDDFADTEEEEIGVHPVVKNITPEQYLQLARALPNCPGMELRAGTTRKYPFHSAGCHVVGMLSQVKKEDLENDPNLDVDPLREYQFNDMMGRTGLEALCEPALRGTRGEVFKAAGREDELHTAPAPGRDVRTTIDIELIDEIQKSFVDMPVPSNLRDDDRSKQITMHGAAVILDVKTNAVRAMVSYPDYDPNDMPAVYRKLDVMGEEASTIAPLMNRATQAEMVPGSTIKPLVGISAITDHLNVPGIGEMTTTKGIECTGFLVLGGKKMPAGRCWVASMYEGIIPSVKHHPIPVEAPHHGVDGNPDGFLEFADALERSCNVYFETVADAFGPERLSAWYYHFGLGRETGIGIAEARGSLPTAMPGRQPSVTWFSGIGQVGVQVTPIQMANVAATIARDGIWMRPKLVEGDVPTSPMKTRDGEKVPDVADLHLDKAALAAAREGMLRVVNSRAGSGSIARMSEFLVAGKTGTAQAPKLRDPIKNPDGSIARDEKGHIKWQLRTPATFEHETDTPWYRGWGEKGEQVDHAWFIGYAPADDPQVAIAVVVQYGGGGGKTAATVGKKALLACVEHGYIKLRK